MARCVSHVNCPTGFCFKGYCAAPSLGDPCNSSYCPTGLLCHSKSQRCVEPGFVPSSFCRVEADCPPERYCSKRTHVCEPRGTYGGVCGPGRPCIDGFQCVKHICEIQCLEDDDCGECECKSLDDGSYKICRVKDHFSSLRMASASCHPRKVQPKDPTDNIFTAAFLCLFFIVITATAVIRLRKNSH